MELRIQLSKHVKNVVDRFVRGDGCDNLPPRIIEDLIRAVWFGREVKGTSSETVNDEYQKYLQNFKGTTTIPEAQALGEAVDVLIDQDFFGTMPAENIKYIFPALGIAFYKGMGAAYKVVLERDERRLAKYENR